MSSVKSLFSASKSSWLNFLSNTTEVMTYIAMQRGAHNSMLEEHTSHAQGLRWLLNWLDHKKTTATCAYQFCSAMTRQECNAICLSPHMLWTF
jgi:hypothetical protein